MALILALLSLFAQAIGLLGIGFLRNDLLVLPRVFYPDGDWSVAGLLPYALETIVGYWPIFLVCAIGVSVAALLMVKARFRTRWYLISCRILGWLWMPLLPVGPVFGATLLLARAHAVRSEGT